MSLTREHEPGLVELTGPVRVPTPAARRAGPWHRIPHAARPVAALVLVGVAVLAPRDLGPDARAALFAFGTAVVLWTLTSLPAGWVALAAVLVLVALGGAEQQVVYDALGSDVVWLMLGAFVLGAAVQTSGLAVRLTAAAAGRGSTVGGVCWRVTWILVPLSLLIPSTSGRAAVMLPVFRSLGRATGGDRQVTRALSLLIPAVVLVSTICTLVGAGSHLVANDLLEQVSGERVSFAEWLLWGAPFGIAASAATCFAVQRLFLDAECRRRPVEVPRSARRPLGVAEKRTLAVTVGMVGAWSTESLHGVEIALVAVVGAVLLTAPSVGVMTWKKGVDAVSWNLVVFVGAALVLGEALIATGAAQWVVEGLFAASGLTGSDSTAVVLVVLALLGLTSHVYLTSHAARAAALVPPLLLLGENLDLNPVAVMFLGTVGMDYCLTFAVSSKALLLYSELDEETFEAHHLLRLSAVLLVAHLALIVVFYLGWWRWTGLAL